MNIGIFSDTFPPQINGVAVSTQNLFNILKKNGHNVYVVTPNAFSFKLEYSENILRIPGFELKKLYGYRMSGFYSSKAMKIIKSWNLEIIHIQTDVGIGIFGKIVALRYKIPTVNTYHTMYEDYTHYAMKGHFDRFAKKVVRVFSKTLAEKCTEFISPSMKTKEAIRGYGADSYINIVPTGIDFSKFKEDIIDQEKLSLYKKEHNLEGKLVLVSLGRLAKEKSLDVIIKGYAKYVLSDNPPSVLLIVGGGPAKDELELLAKNLGISQHVLFTGPVKVEEVSFYYHLGQIFVSASITETQGLTFMEAMASRLVVLARYDDNLINTVIDNQTGFFYTTEDDFKDKVARIAALPPTSIKKILDSALKTVNVYSIEKFYDNIMEVYNRALRKFW